MSDKHPLETAAEKVLQEWAMMLVDPVAPTAELFADDAELYVASIDIDGVISGTLSIVAQNDFAATLVTNLLGEEGASHEQCLDAFREMGNVLTGNFLTEAYGTDTVFDLLNPQVRSFKPESVPALLENRLCFSFLADDLPVAVTFTGGKGS